MNIGDCLLSLLNRLIITFLHSKAHLRAFPSPLRKVVSAYRTAHKLVAVEGPDGNLFIVPASQPTDVVTIKALAKDWGAKSVYDIEQ